MARRTHWHLLALSPLLACTGEADRPPPPAEASVTIGAESTRLEDAAKSARARGRELLLDVDSSRTLSASVGQPKAHELSFAPLRVTLTSGGAERSLGDAAIDARLVPRSDAVLLLSSDRTLWRWTPQGVAPLDDGVVPGIAVSPDGRRVAYAKGDMPELDVWEVELDGGAPRQVTSADGPQHAPTYSADGRRLAWLEYRAGGPALVSAEGPILPRVAVVPDGRRVPVWRDGWVLLHGTAGTVAAREGTGAALLTLPPGGDVALQEGVASVRRADGAWRTLEEGAAR